MSNPKPEELLKLTGIPFLAVEGQWLHVRCPFHIDSHDDLTQVKGRIEPSNGAFKCFACGETKSTIGYIAGVLGKTPAEIKHIVSGLTGQKEDIPLKKVEEWHAALFVNAEQQAILRRKGIGIAEINKYKLGYDASCDRITIPIFHDGKLVNVRKYRRGADKKNKYVSLKGYGGNRIYGIENIDKSTDIIIVEGEFKRIVLEELGFNVCSPTGGASNWDAEWNERFVQKNVILLLDADEAGRKGASKLSSILHKVSASVKDVFLSDTLSLGEGKNDVIDYIISLKKTADDLRKLIIQTPFYEPPKVEEIPDDEQVYDVPLAGASRAEFNRKRVRTKCVVSATTDKPYIIPKTARVRCDGDQSYCNSCHVSVNRGYKFDVKRDDPRILELINTVTGTQFEVMKKIAQVYPKCKACNIDTIESFNVEELRLIPQVEMSHDSSQMVVRRAFSMTHGIQSNSTYEVTARVCVEPQTQAATLIIYDVVPTTDDISQFELKHDLTVFQPSEWTVEAIEAKLDDVYEDLENNVTKIYDRRDLHMFYDLVWHSVLYVQFQGALQKGWVDALVIGDPGQGKSEASSKLQLHYGTGERVDAKSASVAGILGGLQETNNRWFLTWGVIPLNDRRLVLLEELKGMQVEALARLTDMRSSGIAEIRKIHGGRTNARTRLCAISNPRSDRRLCTYNYGVDAVKELMGSLEDIRRFTMAIAVASGDVGLDTINRASSLRPEVAHFYTSELCKHLVMWAWSRNEAQVQVSPDAEGEILEAATRMGKRYSASIPLVMPEDQRIKILKLSAALAARTFSTGDGVNCIIRRCHVAVVERFLDRIYSSKALGYSDFSAAQKAETIIADPEEIEKKIRDMPNAMDSVRTMIESDSIDPQTITDITEWSKEVASQFIGLLVRKQALRKLRRGGYRKTPAFTDLLKKLDREKLNNVTFSEQLNGTGLM